MADEGAHDRPLPTQRTADRPTDDLGRAEEMAAAVLALASADDAELDDVIVEAVGSIARREHADRGYLTDFAADGTFGTSHEWTAPGVESHRPSIKQVPQAGFVWSVAEAQAGRIVAVASLDELPPEAASLAESFGAYGVESILEVPVFLDDQLRWVVGLNRISRPGPWSAEAIDDLERIGDAIGRGLTRRAAVDELRDARDRAERAARAADAFLAQMSHELRTPLHAILGFSELIDTTDSPSTQAAVDHITENGRHLLSLVESLLDLAGFTAAHKDTVVRKVSVGAAVRSVLASHDGHLGEPAIRTVVDDSLDDLLLDVDIDAAYLEGIVRCMVQSVGRPGTAELLLHRFDGDAEVGLAVSADHGRWVPELQRGFPVSRALLAGLGGRLDVRQSPGAHPVAVAWFPAG